MHMQPTGLTLFDTIWDDHRVNAESAPDGSPDTLYIDLHLIHEVTSPQAFSILRGRGLKLRRPGQTVATMDHSIPSTPPGPDGKYVIEDPDAVIQLDALESNCTEFGVPLFPMGHENQGIVHVTAPELGLIQPGMTIVCGDSHTATHGASALWLSASAPARWPMSLPPNASSPHGPRPSRFGSTAPSNRGSRPRTSSYR